MFLGSQHNERACMFLCICATEQSGKRCLKLVRNVTKFSLRVFRLCSYIHIISLSLVRRLLFNGPTSMERKIFFPSEHYICCFRAERLYNQFSGDIIHCSNIETSFSSDTPTVSNRSSRFWSNACSFLSSLANQAFCFTFFGIQSIQINLIFFPLIFCKSRWFYRKLKKKQHFVIDVWL